MVGIQGRAPAESLFQGRRLGAHQLIPFFERRRCWQENAALMPPKRSRACNINAEQPRYNQTRSKSGIEAPSSQENLNRLSITWTWCYRAFARAVSKRQQPQPACFSLSTPAMTPLLE